MDQIKLKNFRCFREEQTARLAPLTLLMGENSTGKTSFMALVRALWDVCYQSRVPDFKEEPYDLGSFDEIAHHRGGRGGRADSFETGFDVADKMGLRNDTPKGNELYRFNITFGKKGTTPIVLKRRFSCDENWIEASSDGERFMQFCIGTRNGAWKWQESVAQDFPLELVDRPELSPFYFSLRRFSDLMGDEPDSVFKPINNSPSLTMEDWKRIENIAYRSSLDALSGGKNRPYASAPVRSKPLRTYDPWHSTRDPEGDYIPTYLANLYFHDKAEWNALKDVLEKFGKEAGLFDEISVRQLGKNESEPFQVQVRKFGSRSKGPQRNLIDVGYGVSQVLPVITELLRRDAPPIFLLQQPEVHLHPSAQAALGSLFCQIAGQGRQLIVETHSDHLLDRVRMDVRDNKTKLKPEDVSILYFERDDLDVHIHSLRFDEQGNVLDAPPSYRQFFMEEMRRSLWKR